MKAVRLALAFHVHRWYCLIHDGASPPPQDPSKDVLAALEEALGAAARPDR